MRFLGKQGVKKNLGAAAATEGTTAISMHNLNEFIASALFNVLSELGHTSDILSHCTPMPELKLLEVFTTPFSFKGQG